MVLVGGAAQMMPASAEATPAARAVVQDRLGDVVDPQVTPVRVPAADITAAALEYGQGWIRAEMRAFDFSNPLEDARWRSDDSFIVWTLETTGDGRPDYLVEYGVTHDKQLYGEVLRAATPDGPAVCGADSVTYSTSPLGGLYELRVDPDCLGRPASIAYTVGMSFDTGAGRGAGPVGTDIVPDRGFAAAVAAPATAAPVQMPSTATSPAERTPAAERPAVAPRTGAPTPAAAPAPVTGDARSVPVTAAVPTSAPTVASLRSSGAPAPALPRTGLSPAAPLAGLGSGLLLIGAGLLVMVQPIRRRRIRDGRVPL